MLLGKEVFGLKVEDPNISIVFRMIETPGGLLVEPILRSLGLDKRPGSQQLAPIGQDLHPEIVVFMVAIVFIKQIKPKIEPYIYTIEKQLY